MECENSISSGEDRQCMKEMTRLNMDMIGLSEVRWTDSGMVDRGTHVMIFSGGKKHQHGVGIMMSKKISSALQGYIPISDRVIVAKFQAKPLDIVVVQVYAPTSDYPDEEIESFYDDVDKALKYAKSQDVVLVLGDLNAKVGKGKDGDNVGDHGLGTRNERGTR